MLELRFEAEMCQRPCQATAWGFVCVRVCLYLLFIIIIYIYIFVGAIFTS